MEIRKMISSDEQEVLAMMRTFYRSPAVFTNGSESIFRRDFAECVGSSPFLEGFILEDSTGVLGYAMLAHSFSTEFGKPCVWVEDIYLKPQARGMGCAPAFLSHVRALYPHSLIRLEVEEDNTQAVSAYRKSGFGTLPYLEMLNDPGECHENQN